MYVIATYGMRSDRLDKVLLNDVMVDGKFFRNHVWVSYSKSMENFERGDLIEFTAYPAVYTGLNGFNEYVQKMGFKKIRNVKKCVLNYIKI